MELRFYLEIVKRHLLAIVIVIAIAMSITAAAGLLLPPIYSATATVRVLLDVGVTDFILREDYNNRLLNTYAKVLTSEPILEEIILRFSDQTESLSVDNLRDDMEVSVVPDTELITISVKNRDSVLARDIANELAALLIDYARNIYVGNGKSTRDILEEQLERLEMELTNDRYELASLTTAGVGDAQIDAMVRQIEFKENAYNQLLDQYELARLNESLRANSVSVMAPATVPDKPTNTFGYIQIGLGATIGLFCGLGLAFVLENLDTRVHSPQYVERVLNMQVLGSVPRGLIPPGDYASDAKDIRYLKDAYRLLSINLLALCYQTSGNHKRTILVTSAATHEGKSTVAANLAQALSERGQTVFLVDTDLRQPTLAKIFGQENDLGLNDLLTGTAPLDDKTLRRLISPTEDPCLFVIGAGSSVANPTARLASPALEQLFKYLRTQGQTTILDAPPVLGMADASLLAPKVDGIVVVVRQAFSSRDAVRETLKQLEIAGARIIGVVFVTRGSDSKY